ncbi:P-loop containing nucleoside triphosphate hydrolase protein [Hyaloscypha variabilis]
MASRCPWMPFENPDGAALAPLFENYLFVLLPASCFVSGVCLRTWALISRETITRQSWVQRAKIALSVLNVGLSVGGLVLSFRSAEGHAASSIAPLSVAVVASIGIVILSVLEHLRSSRPSDLLQIYLLVVATENAYQVSKTACIHGTPGVIAFWVVKIVLVLVLLVLESLHKTSVVLSPTGKVSIDDLSGFFSRRLFWWLLPLFKKGYRGQLDQLDLFGLSDRLRPKEIQEKFNAKLSTSQSQKSWMILFRSIFTDLTSDFLAPVLPKLCYIGTLIAQPFLIRALLNFVTSSTESAAKQGPYFVLLVLLEYVGLAVFNAWYWQSVSRFNTKLRAYLIRAIYTKTLSSKVAENAVLTLLTVDVERLLLGSRVVHELWGALVPGVVALCLLQAQIGLISLNLLFLVAFVTAVTYIAGRMRIKFISAIPGFMKSIKMLGFTEQALDAGKKLRDSETRALMSVNEIYLSFNDTMLIDISGFTVFQFAILLVFLPYGILVTLRGDAFSIQRLYTSITIIKLFTQPLIDTIENVPAFLQAMASMQRIAMFMAREDRRDPRQISEPDEWVLHDPDDNIPSEKDRNQVVQFDQLQHSYDDSRSIFSEVSGQIAEGSLNLVLGESNSGKSTLLHALVGEVEIKSGVIKISHDRVAYCDQMPWVFHGTIKDNIVAGEPFDDTWFSIILWACCLDIDVRLLSNGIHTPAGENGSNLSGGQKSRVSLARAHYSRRPVVVIDDAFSSLDRRVAAAVFHRVFGTDGIQRQQGITVILAASSFRWIKHADQVFILSSGTLAYTGPSSSIPGLFQNIATSEEDSPDPQFAAQEILILPKAGRNDAVSGKEVARPRIDSRRQGAIYKDYLRSFGWYILLIYVILLTVSAGATALQYIWLKRWGDAMGERAQLAKFASVFAVISLLSLGAVVAWNGYSYWCALLRSGTWLYMTQFTSVLRTSYINFIQKDAGDLINRFSQDIALIDSALGRSFVNFTNQIFSSIASCILLVLATYYILAVLPLVFIVFWVIQRVYLRTSRQIRVMALETKAPLCSHFLSSIAGRATILSFGWSKQYKEKTDQLLENSQVAYYLQYSTQNWLVLVLELTAAGLAVCFGAIVVSLKSRIDPGFLGLALNSMIDLVSIFPAVVKSWTTFETSLGTIARARQLMLDMPHEKKGSFNPPISWPSEGEIVFRDICGGYSESEGDILKGVSVTIPSGKRFAVCGRTGSGKSSFLSSILKLLHVSRGEVFIDGIDISTVSTDLLSSRIITLPQELWFMPGTVRDNLTIRARNKGSISDSEALLALQKVRLRTKFEARARDLGFEGKVLDLDFDVKAMLTAGEEQLFAIACAMFTEGNILVMDEATSRLDKDNEQFAQRVIKDHFGDITTITVAHHLDTIMEYDMVGVMDHGVFVEMGKPEVLVRTPNSYFRNLVGLDGTVGS